MSRFLAFFANKNTLLGERQKMQPNPRFSYGQRWNWCVSSSHYWKFQWISGWFSFIFLDDVVLSITVQCTKFVSVKVMHFLWIFYRLRWFMNSLQRIYVSSSFSPISNSFSHAQGFTKFTVILCELLCYMRFFQLECGCVILCAWLRILQTDKWFAIWIVD